MILCGNNIINDGLTVTIQVVFVFSFLVLFYFMYVVNIEKKDFQEQIDLIVDDLMIDIKSQLDSIIESDMNKIPKDDFNLILFGTIDTIEEKINMASKEAVKSINDNNNKLKNNVFNVLIVIMVVSVLLMILLSCYPVFTILKESIITIFFIAMVELIFLTYISGKYISADPNKIKNLIGVSVQKWLQNNNKVVN
jgi:hypothetical protein